MHKYFSRNFNEKGIHDALVLNNFGNRQHTIFPSLPLLFFPTPVGGGEGGGHRGHRALTKPYRAAVGRWRRRRRKERWRFRMRAVSRWMTRSMVKKFEYFLGLKTLKCSLGGFYNYTYTYFGHEFFAIQQRTSGDIYFVHPEY